MNNSLTIDEDYSLWLKELKNKVRLVQIKAVVKVNSELLQFYWELGADIVEKQATAKWGDGFLSNLSHDLMVEFPEMKGFSKRNLELIRQWYLFYTKEKPIAIPAIMAVTNDSNKSELAPLTLFAPIPTLLAISAGLTAVASGIASSVLRTSSFPSSAACA